MCLDVLIYDMTSEVIEAFSSTSRYLDGLLNIDNTFFDSMVNHIYPSELQLNKANVSDTEASFLDLHLSISIVFTLVYGYAQVASNPIHMYFSFALIVLK